jgi:hemerythrin-like domain-containing protein
VARLHRTRGEAIEGRPRSISPLGGPTVDEDLLDLSPADLLGAEHDLIRRVITVLERHSARIGGEGRVDPVFLADIVDFVHIYAGRVHHGKEEEILFRQLDERDLTAEHRQMMEELVREHVAMRQAASDLRQANEAYREGSEEAVEAIQDAIDTLLDLYPGHMEREDADFFPAVMDYLDEAQRRGVLERMRGHDRAMIHERYGGVAEQLDAVSEDWALRE